MSVVAVSGVDARSVIDALLSILLLTYLRTGLQSRRLIALGNGVYYHQDNELYGNEKLCTRR